MTVTLRITNGPQQGRSVPCDRELVIGREGADVVLADEEVSGRHAVMRPVGQGIEIEDLGSINGTFVNGERISGKASVTSGAEVKLGSTQLAVEVAAPAEAAAHDTAPDTRPPEVKARQEAVTAIRDVPPPLGPPPTGPPGGRPPREAGGPPGRRPPPPVRLLMKTPLGRLMVRRRMARMAKRGGPPGQHEG